MNIIERFNGNDVRQCAHYWCLLKHEFGMENDYRNWNKVSLKNPVMSFSLNHRIRHCFSSHCKPFSILHSIIFFQFVCVGSNFSTIQFQIKTITQFNQQTISMTHFISNRISFRRSIWRHVIDNCLSAMSEPLDDYVIVSKDLPVSIYYYCYQSKLAKLVASVKAMFPSLRAGFL